MTVSNTTITIEDEQDHEYECGRMPNMKLPILIYPSEISRGLFLKECNQEKKFSLRYFDHEEKEIL